MAARKRIMLVDDDNSCRIQGRAILKGTYEVFPIPSAYKLFETLEVVSPDLILLDIHMPVVDGFKALARLKDSSRYESIPVILLTGSKDKESVIKGTELGAAGFVTKPFEAEYLIRQIEKCLNTSSTGNESENTDSERYDSKKRVILAVDDAPDILRSVHSMLHEKYKVYTLPKPEKLESLLLTVVPDLFLLDYMMPTMSGFELIQIIRKNPEHKDTPVILLTSEGTLDNISKAVELGACDFIAKPFEINVLRKKVMLHMAKS